MKDIVHLCITRDRADNIETMTRAIKVMALREGWKPLQHFTVTHEWHSTTTTQGNNSWELWQHQQTTPANFCVVTFNSIGMALKVVYYISIH